MSNNSQRIFVITGANRGIGIEMVKYIIKNPNNVVYAGCRTPSKSTDLIALSKENDRIKVIEWDVTAKPAHDAAAKRIKEDFGRVDTVIANAGIMPELVPLLDVDGETLTGALQTNVIGGNLFLYQAFEPLLARSDNPKYIAISTIASRLSGQFPIPNSAYAISKAAVNMVLQRIHIENERITSFPIHPGMVKTDMDARASKFVRPPGGDKGLFPDPIEPEESAEKMIQLIESATRQTHAGKLWSYDGTVLGW